MACVINAQESHEDFWFLKKGKRVPSSQIKERFQGSEVVAHWENT